MAILHSFLPLLVLSLCLLARPSQAFTSKIHQNVKRTQIRDELGPLLSKGAVIVDSESGNLTEATKRWQVFASPTFNAVVQVATEDDIIQTIRYANAHSIPFLAVNAGHGEIKSLGNLRNGIQITIRAMNKITIKGDTAIVQGGASNLDMTRELWNAKKYTVTGTCECVGFLGPALGGGHGFIQGYHGLAADQLLEARVILANGTAITASKTTNSDLFWALRGAGHNFGIVTEVTTKIYDVPSADTWYYENFVYSGESIEQVFGQLDTMKKNMPAQLQHYAVFFRSAEVDPVNTLISFSIMYNGPVSEAEQWTKPFRQFKPLSNTNGTYSYPQLSSITGNGINDDICQHENLNRIRYPIYLDGFKSGLGKAVYDLFNKTTAQYPALSNSLMLFEGLSAQGVAAVQLDSTAVPLRKYFVLASPVVTYSPDASLDTIAQDFGRNIRSTLQSFTGSTELHAYVNYAVGEEPLESIYGYRGWRLAKLKTLKKQFDPQNAFRWYAPIVQNASGR